MAKVTYIAHDGRETTLDVADGQSVMQAAVAHDLDGIVGECGGSQMCATCHVYVDEARLADLPPMEQVENEMLEYTAAPRQPNSRLSCQLLGPAIDGLRVRMPDTQR